MANVNLSECTPVKFRCSAARPTASASQVPTSLCIATFDEVLWQGKISDKSTLGNSIPYLRPEDVSYRQFFDDFLLKNVPCMFSSSITESWLSRRLWCNEVGGSEAQDLNYEYLLGIYGDTQVNAVNCNDTEYREGYGSKDCREMTFKEYIEYLDTSTVPAGESSSLYLKDWHIVRAHKSLPGKEDSLPYQCPVYFQSDWLNEFCEDKDLNDYKFCYMGPKGTFTSFHADVYGSYSWSANVLGVKKWYVYPPGKELRFYNERLKKFCFNWNDPGVPGEDYIEVIQKSGECIFVPSGWHHVVWNVTDAVSINHNWFNGSNICYIWNVLQNALKDVEKELDDLCDIPEFQDQCQLVLKANHGLNYEGFFEILSHVMEKRSKYLNSVDEKENGVWQARFDIEAILHVIQDHCMEDATVQKHFSECAQAIVQNQ